jgi:very-short-patch-repair endonuclease
VPTVPGVLLQPFSMGQAVQAGVGVKALRRLLAAGLVRPDPVGLLRLVEPVQPERLAHAAVGPPSALCGTTAAAFYGWPLLTPPHVVELTVPPWRSPTCWPSALIRRRGLPASDLVVVGGVEVTSPVRTALDIAAWEPLGEALVVLDAVLRRRILDQRHLREGLETCRATRGRRRQVLAVSLADGRRASPPESTFRALVHEARLPAPVQQLPIYFRGSFVGRVDFAWPDRRVLVEINGFAYHADMAGFRRDQRRYSGFTRAGWRVLPFAAADLQSRPVEVIDEVRSTLALPLPRQSR